eukprot:4577101-Prymnesium_polylepis.1
MTEGELAVANWSSHSFRRGADKQVRKWAMAHGVPLKRVDLSFGWNQAGPSTRRTCRRGTTRWIWIDAWRRRASQACTSPATGEGRLGGCLSEHARTRLCEPAGGSRR